MGNFLHVTQKSQEIHKINVRETGYVLNVYKRRSDTKKKINRIVTESVSS